MVFVWVALYGLTYTLAGSPGLPGWILSLAMMLYVCFFVLWIHRMGQSRSIGLCAMVRFQPKEYLYFLPLSALPLFNLLNRTSDPVGLSEIVLMLSVSTAEEIFFRGFLLRYVSGRNRLAGILITGAIFAVFHCANLLSSPDPVYTLMQVLCAFAAGVCYCAIAIIGGSLLPCIIAHGLTNVTGIGSGWNLGGLWLCIAVYACYGIWLCRRIR